MLKKSYRNTLLQSILKINQFFLAIGTFVKSIVLFPLRLFVLLNIFLVALSGYLINSIRFLLDTISSFVFSLLLQIVSLIRRINFRYLGLIIAGVLVSFAIYSNLEPEKKPLLIYDRSGILLFEKPGSNYKRAPHAVDYVLSELSTSHSDILNYGGTVITTIDIKLQNKTQEKMVEQGQTNFSLVIRKDDGSILSLVGKKQIPKDSRIISKIINSKGKEVYAWQ